LHITLRILTLFFIHSHLTATAHTPLYTLSLHDALPISCVLFDHRVEASTWVPIARLPFPIYNESLIDNENVLLCYLVMRREKEQWRLFLTGMYYRIEIQMKERY